jgi:hypothetical protein
MLLKIEFLNNKEIEINLTEKEYELLNIASEFINLNEKNDSEIILKSDFFSKKRKVPDVFRYTLNFNDSWELKTHNRASKPFKEFYDENMHYKFKDRGINEADNNNIVVILESPHKKEYDSNFNAIAPAVGTTGNNFEKYFLQYILPILNNLGLFLDQSQKYNILFVNPVPYQVSLAHIHNEGMKKGLKIKVWQELFKILKEDFKNNINNNIEAEIIINAATSGVKDDITKLFKNKIVFEVPHPSSWHFLKSFKKNKE